MNVYLDHNATTHARACAREAALKAIDLSGNASSVHDAGRRAKAVLDRARAQVANLADVGSREVVFTSGGTEANNLALKAFGAMPLLVSAIEHPSVLNVRKDATIIPVGPDGCLNLDALEQLLTGNEVPMLVSVMAANNETGVIQPIEDVVSLARKHGAMVHSDAVQAAGKIDSAWQQADLVTLSGHKLGGIQGAGALIVRKHISLKAVMGGGGQELGMRPGTEALPAIAAFGAAANEAVNDDLAGVASWRDALEHEMLAAAPDAVVLGREAERLANTLCIAHPRIDAETMVMSFDLAGVAVSAGSACSSGKMAASHVAVAMGHDGLARNAVRLSLGWSTTQEDCLRAAAVWKDIVTRFEERHRAA